MKMMFAFLGDFRWVFNRFNAMWPEGHSGGVSQILCTRPMCGKGAQR
jgi:hypothetical protein